MAAEQRQVGAGAAAAVEQPQIGAAAGGLGQPRRDEAAKAPEPEVGAFGAVGELEQAVHAAARAAGPAWWRRHGTIRPACAIAGCEAAAVLVGAFVLTAALTYPALPKLDRVGRVNTDDGRLSIWNVAWVADALIVNPRGLFDANIFYPAPQHARLLRSQHRRRACWRCRRGASPAIRISRTTPSWSVRLRRWRSPAPTTWCAICPAAAKPPPWRRCSSRFCPFIFARTAHIQLLMTVGLPFSMLAFHRLVDRADGRARGRARPGALGPGAVVRLLRHLRRAHGRPRRRSSSRRPAGCGARRATGRCIAPGGGRRRRPDGAVLPALPAKCRIKASAARSTTRGPTAPTPGPGWPRRPGRTGGGWRPSRASARCCSRAAIALATGVAGAWIALAPAALDARTSRARPRRRRLLPAARGCWPSGPSFGPDAGLYRAALRDRAGVRAPAGAGAHGHRGDARAGRAGERGAGAVAASTRVAPRRGPRRWCCWRRSSSTWRR